MNPYFRYLHSFEPMPGDTLIITSSGDTVRLPDSLLRVVHAYPTHGNGSLALSDTTMFWVGMAIVGLIVAGRPFLLHFFRRRQRKRLQEEASADLDSHQARYDAVLSVYNSYYRSLSPALRNRFLQRVAEFMETKKFEYIEITPDDKMPLLISAAAIQLTFGLEKYLMEYFDTIYVLKHDYRYGLYNVPFMGHVSSNGIYLSWDNFLFGYSDDTDADNVGVHEMAHALAYVNFMAGSSDDVDDEFKKGFREFSKIARPIFNDMQNGAGNMLGDYAATNYNEFWAVAVENFFEKPAQLKELLPAFYAAMCRLLNQNPLLVDKGVYPGVTSQR